MFSKRSLEGYLQIDHRDSPGLPEDFARKIGLAPGAVAEGTNFETPVITCSHCNVTVILNPLRTRPRNHCKKCDAYICDNATCNLECKPFSQLLDEYEKKIIQGKVLTNG